MSSFISEILVLVGTYARQPAAALVAVPGIILASIYILLTYQRMFTGPAREYASGWRDMDVREAWVVAPLIAVIIALGVYPKPVLDVLNPAVSRTMHQVGLTDPAPTVATGTAGANGGTTP
jgi:NADH-quinone oxidoreductase subunit M